MPDLSLQCLPFPAALKKAKDLGGAVVHLMGEQPRYGYDVDDKGQVKLASSYTYKETVKDLTEENWMVTPCDEE